MHAPLVFIAEVWLTRCYLVNYVLSYYLLSGQNTICFSGGNSYIQLLVTERQDFECWTYMSELALVKDLWYMGELCEIIF